MKILHPGVYEEYIESLAEYHRKHGNCLFIPFRSKLDEYKSQIAEIGKELDRLQKQIGYSYETLNEFSIDVYSLCGMIKNRTNSFVGDAFIALEKLYQILNDFSYCIVSSTIELTSNTPSDDKDCLKRVYDAMKNLLSELSGCSWYVHILTESLLSPSLVYKYRSLVYFFFY